MKNNIQAQRAEIIAKRIDRLDCAYWRTQDRIDDARWDCDPDYPMMERLYARSERLHELIERCYRQLAVALVLAADFDRRYA